MRVSHVRMEARPSSYWLSERKALTNVSCTSSSASSRQRTVRLTKRSMSAPYRAIISLSLLSIHPYIPVSEHKYNKRREENLTLSWLFLHFA